MLITAGVMRLFLGLGVIAMASLAIFYLRQRRLTLEEFIAWGLIVIFIPVFGPFWVIYKHPGKPAWSRRKYRLGHRRNPPLNWLSKWVS